jgi:hypothetical protein
VEKYSKAGQDTDDIMEHAFGARWIPKATNKHFEYVIFIAFPLQQWLHERASVLRYTFIPCLFYFHIGSNPSKTIPGHRFLKHTVECQKE